MFRQLGLEPVTDAVLPAMTKLEAFQNKTVPILLYLDTDYFRNRCPPQDQAQHQLAPHAQPQQEPDCVPCEELPHDAAVPL